MFRGSGPGLQTPDGCSVELYALLPYLDDLGPVRAAFGTGSTVLELGCGAGRLTRKLIEWGFSVTAVDESEAMLAELPPGTHAVHSPIEALNLDTRFDCALLAGCLINHPVVDTRRAFLSSAIKHLKLTGVLILERQDADWLPNAQVGLVRKAGPVSVQVVSVGNRGNFVDMTVRYECDQGTWLHEFSAEVLSEKQIEQILHEHGVGRVTWHGPRRRWAVGAKFAP